MFHEFQENDVHGFYHPGSGQDAIVLAHGAGSNSRAPLLVAVAEEFVRLGLVVLRCDLPFRRAHAGPPRPADAARDREGLRRAVDAVQRIVQGRVFLGGHSYGGRQATMLAAEDPAVAPALLLLSYPLHPPGKPAQLRTAHLPQLRVPALFAHGSRDDFGTRDEMETALALIPARTRLLVIEGAGHDLKRGRDLTFCAAFIDFLNQ
ncbi:MAG: alpha/beta fold hydrolase [Bryobacteraceae bacterium]